MIRYKGYTGVFEYDEEYGFFAGHVVDVRDGIYFEGRSVADRETPGPTQHATESVGVGATAAG